MKIYELEDKQSVIDKHTKTISEISSIAKSSAALMTSSQFDACSTMEGPLHNTNSNSSVSQNKNQHTRTKILYK